MKNKILSLTLLFMTIFSYSAVSQDLYSYDYSDVFKEDNYLGYIGKDYKRLYIYYSSITKNSKDTYTVVGKSMTGGNICAFEGSIKIDSFKKLDKDSYEAGYEAFVLVGTYQYKETQGKFRGTFKGNVEVSFYIEDGRPHLEDSMIGADGYSNKMHEGVWINDNTKASKPANWGMFRIPDSGDLDQGVGEFYPAEKYHSKGWKSRWDMLTAQDDIVRAQAAYIESREWWNNDAPHLKISSSDGKVFIDIAKGSDGKFLQHLDFPTKTPPVLIDLNFDGYNDLAQLADDGVCYLWDKNTGKFVKEPSYDKIDSKGNLITYPSKNYIVTTKYELKDNSSRFFMYRFDVTTKKFEFMGAIQHTTEGYWREYNSKNQLVRNNLRSPSDLSKVWSDYIKMTMAQ